MPCNRLRELLSLVGRPERRSELPSCPIAPRDPRRADGFFDIVDAARPRPCFANPTFPALLGTMPMAP